MDLANFVAAPGPYVIQVQIHAESVSEILHGAALSRGTDFPHRVGGFSAPRDTQYGWNNQSRLCHIS